MANTSPAKARTSALSRSYSTSIGLSPLLSSAKTHAGEVGMGPLPVQQVAVRLLHRVPPEPQEVGPRGEPLAPPGGDHGVDVVPPVHDFQDRHSVSFRIGQLTFALRRPSNHAATSRMS